MARSVGAGKKSAGFVLLTDRLGPFLRDVIFKGGGYISRGVYFYE